MNFDIQYKNIINKILSNGIQKGDRTGTGTKSLFGEHIEINIENSFPLLTLKSTPFRLIKEELFWMLGLIPQIYYDKLDNPLTNVKYLLDNNINIWNEWAYEKTKKRYPIDYDVWINNIKFDWDFANQWGNLGPIYGKQWTNWNGFNQIEWALKQIKLNPNDRGILVSGWNVDDLNQMSLRPCHTFHQWYVRNEYLDIHLYQRSCDVFLGMPFNIAAYSLLNYMFSNLSELKPGKLIVSYGDIHIYSNHFEQCQEILNREPYNSPQLIIDTKLNNLEAFKNYEFKILNYQSHPKIKADVAI